MYVPNQLPPPLSYREFYILLALHNAQSHVYHLKIRILNFSRGSIDIPTGTLYPLVTKLHEEGLIELVEYDSDDFDGKTQKIYTTSEQGTVRLKNELQRFRHAVKIGESAGLFREENPSYLTS